MKRKFSSFTKTKIIISYLLLFLLSTTAIFLTYKEIQDLIQKDVRENISSKKMKYLSETLSTLYDSESIIGTFIVIDVSEFNLYKQKTTTAKVLIDTLINLTQDSNQKKQLDSVLILLYQKEKNIENLALLSKKYSIERLYEKNILETLNKENSIKDYQKAEKRIIVKQDTLLLSKPSERKNFFKRLSDVFFTPDPDTSVQIRSSEYTIIDSLISSYNPADSINRIFDDVQDNIKNEKAQLNKLLLKKVNSLRENSNLITKNINEILHDFEQEEINLALLLLKEKEDILSKVTNIIIYIAAISIFLILFFIFLIWRDISKSRLYRKRLEDANRMTQNLLENREKLMLSITHDIKAPLGSIIGYIELLNNSKLTERQLYYLENMKNSSEHLLHLISNILDFNRLNSGNIELNTLPFNEEKLFQEIFSSFQPLIEKKGLRFTFEHKNNLQTKTLIGDPLRIRQITNNLLSNALKFTNEGEIRLKTEILEENNNFCFLKISISDTGIGISEKNQEIIFQEYTRILNKKQENTEGFGLGLSIVHKLIEIQNGKISVSSKQGEGSIFTVTLSLPILEEKNNLSLSFNDVPKILIIDDDPSQLTMISEQLKTQGIIATTCKNPYEALRIIEIKKFDLIFTDIQMPELNGFEIIKHIRNAHLSNATTIPVIALSARADITLSQFKEHGFSSFLNKPFNSAQLFSIISQYISTDNSYIKSGNNLNVTESKFDKLLSFASGEPEAEQAILQSFICESKKNISLLSSALKKDDLKKINQLAHKMLPLFRMLEETEIITWLSNLETTIDPTQIETKNFLKQISRIQEIINEGNELFVIKKKHNT